MRPLISPSDSDPAGLGPVPTIGGSITTAIPDPITGISEVQTQQSNTTATQAVSQAIVFPPIPYLVIQRVDPSGILTMWLQTLYRKLGGYFSTPTDDAFIVNDTENVKGWVAGQGFANGLDFLLDNEPMFPGLTYSTTWAAKKVTNESWFISGPTLLKSIDYTYLSGKVGTEIRKIFSGDGATILAQSTITYTFSNGYVISSTYTRDI